MTIGIQVENSSRILTSWGHKELVSGDEVMKVIQRRLFNDVGDPAVIQEIALSQAELFRKYRESCEDTRRGKQEVLSQADLLAQRIQFSYLFHPDLSI